MDLFSIALAKQMWSSESQNLQVQADWSENDDSEKSYIKNRPFYEIEKIETTSVTLEALNYDTSEEFRLFPKIGLIEGEEYQITLSNGENSETVSCPGTAISGEDSGIDVNLISISGYFESVLDVSFELIDKINFDMTEFTFVYDNEHSFATFDVSGNFTITIAGKLDLSEIKKINKKFLPDDFQVKLNIATEDKAGLCKPMNKTEEQNLPVSIDEKGQLWTESEISNNPNVSYQGELTDFLPVYKFPDDGRLYAKIRMATNTQSGAVTLAEKTGYASDGLPCYLDSSNHLYAKKPSVSGTLNPTGSSLVSEKAIAEYVKEQIGIVYSDLEGGVY